MNDKDSDKRRMWKYGSQYALPPKSELGEPKKKWEDTFSAVTALKEHFSKASKPIQ